MTKLLHFLSLSMMLMFASLGYAQTIRVEIGTASSSTTKAPFSNDKKCATVQMVYPAESIGVEGTIDTIWFYCATPGSLDQSMLKILMGHTSSEILDGWAPVSDVVVVDSNSFSHPTEAGWFPLVLQTPFEYNGVDNLVVITQSIRDAVSSTIKYSSFSAINHVKYRAANLASAANAYPPGGAISTASDLPIIRLSITQQGCSRPKNLGVSNLSSYHAMISWNDVANYAVRLTSQGVDTTILVEGGNSCEFDFLEENTDYDVAVCRLCGADSSVWSTIHFKTLVELAEMPYFCDFENDDENGRWALNNGTNVNGWAIGTAVGGNAGGSLYISNDGGVSHGFSATNYGVVYAERLVELTESGDYNVSFDWMQGAGDRSYVKVALVPSDVEIAPITTASHIVFPAGSVLLCDENIQGSSTWAHYAGTSQSLVQAGGYKLVFAWTVLSGANAPAAAIDNVSLSISLCSSVDGVTVDNITSNTADFTMEGVTDDYVLLYRVVGTEVYDTLYIGNPHTLEPLLPQTDYEGIVYSDCGDNGLGLRGVTFSFTTECGLVEELPYTQPTEWDMNRYPVCWSVIDDNNSTYRWMRANAAGLEGNPCILFNGSTTVSNDDWLIMPGVLYTGEDELVVWLKSSSAANNNSIQVLYSLSDDPTDKESYGPLGTLALNSTDWKRYIVSLAEVSGPAYIAFAVTSPCATFYMDGVQIKEASVCPEIMSVAVSNITTSSARISWTIDNQVNIPVQSYKVTLRRGGRETEYTTTSTTFNITGLHSNMSYRVSVQAVCAGGESVAVEEAFQTECEGGGDVMITGTSAITTYLLPIDNYYNYSYTQMLYLASEINRGAGAIDSIAFDYQYSEGTTVKNNVSIYVAQTTQTSLTSWYPHSNFTLVYQGDFNCAPNSWRTIRFTTPFQYDGVSNLIIAVDDNSFAHNGSTYVFGAHSASGMSIYYHNDYTNFIPGSSTQTPSPSSIRPNLKIFAGCAAAISCVAPNVTLSSITETSATLTWTPGFDEDTWRVEYRKAGGPWVVAEEMCQEQEYTIDDLSQNSDYSFRVISICGVDDEATSTIVSGHTMAFCPSVVSLQASNVTINSFDLTWQIDNASETVPLSYHVDIINPLGQVVVSTSSSDMSYQASDLNHSTTYIVRVVAECPEGNGDTAQITVATQEYVDPASFIYTCDFESDNSDWVLENGTRTNQWQIGTATNNGGSQAIYVSEDNGTSNTYSITSTSTTYAYVPITFSAPGEYQVRYDWKCAGESSFDYLKVLLDSSNIGFVAGTSTTIPTGSIILYDGERLNQNPTWTTTVKNFEIEAPGTYYLALFWHNDATVGTQPPAAVDNIIVRAIAIETCFAPNNVVATASGAHEAVINIDGTAPEYAIIYRAVSGGNYDTIITSESEYTLEDLPTNRSYVGMVYGVCEDGSYTRSSKFFSFTLENCAGPTNAEVVVNNTSSATLYIEGLASEYAVLFKEYSATTYDTIMVSASNYMFENLTLNGSYNGLVYSVCEDGDLSNQAVPFSFTISDPNAVAAVLDFENEQVNSGWTLVNGTSTNRWVIDTAAHTGEGNHGLYISDDNGASNEYTEDASCTNLAWYPVHIPAGGEFSFSFDWRCAGEYYSGSYTTSYYDYMRVALVPSSYNCVSSASSSEFMLPTGGYWLDGNNHLMGEESWQHVSTNLELEEGGDYKLVVVWINDFSDGNQPPAAIDNISIDVISVESCAKPSRVVATADDPHTATISIIGGASEYLIYYKESSASEYDSVETSSSEYVLEDLPTNTTYTGMVYSICEDGSRSRSAKTFSFTLQNCEGPTNVVATTNGAHSATIAITGSAEEYEILYRSESSSVYDTIRTESSEYTLEDLPTNATYIGMVYSICEDGGYSRISVPFSFMLIDTTSLLCYIDFEDAQQNNNWTLANTTLMTNQWAIGTAANNRNGSHSLYISNNNGLANEYTTSSQTCTHYAWYPIQIPAGGAYAFSYDWRCKGENNYDYMRVALVPSSYECVGTATNKDFDELPENSYWLDGGMQLCGQDQWQRNRIELSFEDEGSYKLLVVWTNDNSVGYQPPAAIDNIFVEVIAIDACPKPDSVYVSAVENGSVTISAHATSTNNFMVVWKEAEAMTYDTIVMESTYTFTNIPDMHKYIGTIYSMCSDSLYSRRGVDFTFSSITPAQIPFEENFELSHSGWEYVSDTDNKWCRGTAVHNGEGVSAMYISNNNGENNQYTTTQSQVSYAYRTIIMDSGSYVVSFDWKNVGESTDYMKVMVLPSEVALVAGTGASSNNVLSSNLYDQEEWVRNTSYLDIPQAGEYKLVFMWRNNDHFGSQPPAAVDNISIRPEPCVGPSQLVVSNITGTSAMVAVEGSSTDSLLLVYKKSTETAYDTLRGTSPFVLTNLEEQTSYQVMAYTYCEEGGMARQSASASFTTQCGSIVEFPWNCGFENMTWLGTAENGSVQYPQCWSASNNQNPNSYWYKASGNSHRGSTSIGFKCANADTASRSNDILLTPSFELTGNQEMTFWVKGVSTRVHSRLYVKYTTDQVTYHTLPIHNANRVSVEMLDITTDQWNQYTVYLTSIEGVTNLAFVVDTNSGAIYIDDINVVNSALCPAPANVVCTATTATTASFEITDDENAEWTIYYKYTGTIYDSVVVTSRTPIIDSLEPNKLYTFYVKSNCYAGGKSYATATAQFQTACASISLPVVETFEDWDPSCWSLKPLDSRFTIETTQASQGAKSMKIAASSTLSKSMLITPPIEEELSMLKVSFAVKAAQPTTIKVGAMTDPNGSNTYTNIFTLNIDETWQTFELGLSSYTGVGHYFAIVSESESEIYIDNLIIDTLNGCLTPFNFKTSSTSTTTLTLTWNANGNSAFDVQYGHVGFTLGTGDSLFVENANTCTLVDLDTATSYDVYLRANCGNSVSAWKKLVAKTDPPIAMLPYVCNFDDNADEYWEFHNGSDVNKWYIGSAGGHQGNGLFISQNGVSNTYNTSSTSTVTATRLIRLPQGQVHISYDWNCFGESIFDFIRVALVPFALSQTLDSVTDFTTTTLPTGWIAIDGGSKLNAVSSWQTKTVNIDIATAGDYYITYLWKNDGSSGSQPGANIDNISFTSQNAIPTDTCPIPTAVQVVATSSSAELSWTGNGMAYQIGWKPANDTAFNYYVTTETTYSITNLTPGEEYVYSLKQICRVGDTSEAAIDTFATTICATPYDVDVATTAYSVDITWTGSGIAYQLGWRLTSSPEYTFVTTTDTTYHIANLERNTDYTYCIKQICAVGDTSMTLIGTFTTDNVTCPVATGLQVNEYGETSATISWDANPNITRWELHLFNDEISRYDTIVMAHVTTLTNLEPGVFYSVSVRAFCLDDLMGDWCDTIAVYIVEGQECPPVSNITFSNITENSVEVNWTSVPSVERWQIQIGVHGFTLSPNGGNVVANRPQVLRNLQPNTQYDVYVRSVCSNTEFSEWSTPATFTTLAHQGIDGVDNTVTIAINPNPAHETTQINVKGAQGDITIIILDMSGRVMASYDETCDADCVHTINVSNLAKGTYFVRVMGQDINSIRKLVIY